MLYSQPLYTAALADIHFGTLADPRYVDNALPLGDLPSVSPIPDLALTV